MEVILAKSAGFCFGVERAVNMVYTEVDRAKGKVYTFGPIIHNEEVVKDLEEKGVTVLNTVDEIMTAEKGTVIIRSHGVAPDVYEAIEKAGHETVDATCPFVKKIHTTVAKYSDEGYDIIILGNPSHPEVEGIRGWCREGHVHILQSKDEIEALEPFKNRKFCVVAQTTSQLKKFKDLVESLKNNSYNCYVVNTICNATAVRQEEAADIAKKADVMFVIGGKSSSNSQKLFDICKANCKNTYFLQTARDLDFIGIPDVKTIGITAGASTPNYIIKEVQNYVRIKF